MTNGLDPTTPHLKAAKDLFDAYCSLDIKNVEPLISKDFTFQTFPKIAEHPDEAKDAHFERYGKLLSSMSKIEVTYHEVIEAPGKVTLHVSVILVTVGSTELDYDSLAIFTLVEEDGKLKVAEFKDFSDPTKRSRLHGWAADALAQMAT